MSMMGFVAGQMRRAPAAPRYLLDDYPNAYFAYSTRRLRSDYDGPCMRVRRVSDDAFLDIGFNYLGRLDTSALLSFAGSGTVSIAHWYDQSISYLENIDDRRYLKGAASNLEPIIVDNGVVPDISGSPSVKFSGTHGLFVERVKPVQAGVYSRTMLCAFRNEGTALSILYETGGAGSGSYMSDRAGILIDINEASAGGILIGGAGASGSTYVTSPSGAAAVGRNVVFKSVFDQSGTSYLTEFPVFRVNGIDGFSGTGEDPEVPPANFTNTQFSIGCRTGGSTPKYPFTGCISEFITFEGAAYAPDPLLDGNLIDHYL